MAREDWRRKQLKTSSCTSRAIFCQWQRTVGWAKLICICSRQWLWSENVSPGKNNENLAAGEGASEVKTPLCWIWTCNSCSRLLCVLFRWCLKSYNKGLSRFVLDCALSGQQAGVWEKAAGGCSLRRKGRDEEGGNGEELWKIVSE